MSSPPQAEDAVVCRKRKSDDDGNAIVKSIGVGETITIPQDLYWKYVQEYTPIKDRPILNKRTGSTRFYAGDRVPIDEQFLKKYGVAMKYDGVPAPTGVPGTSSFRMNFSLREGSIKYKESDPNTALELLQNARESEHMSLVSCPVKRLHYCLDMFVDNDDIEIPLFFPGKGHVRDVVRHHALLNPRSINDRSVLGFWISKYLCHAREDINCQANFLSTGRVKMIVQSLFDADPDVTPFFDEGWEGAFHYDIDKYYEPGSSIMHCMERCSEYYWKEPDEGFRALDWVIDKLEEKAGLDEESTTDEDALVDLPLRFRVGDRVECKMGRARNSWRSGTITRAGKQTWLEHLYPYDVELDCGGEMPNAYAPFDSDEVIRALVEE